MLVSTAWAAPAQAVETCPDGNGCIEVQVVNADGSAAAGGRVFTPAELGSATQDVIVDGEGRFTTRTSGGALGESSHPSGTSVRAVLQLALGDAFARVAGAVVQRPTNVGAPSQDNLSAQDLQMPGSIGYPFPPDPADVTNPSPTPMFFVLSNNQVSYGRPLRDLSSDVNVPQNLNYDSTSAPLVLRATLAPGAALRPVITASDTTPDPGDPVAFSLSYADANRPDGDDVTYHWDFSNGGQQPGCTTSETNQGPAPTHIFTTRTDFEVTVKVCGSTRSGVSAPALRVRVNRDKDPDPDPDPGGSGSPTNPKDGGNAGTDGKGGRNKGGTPTDVDGPGGDKSANQRGRDGSQDRQQQATAGKKDVTRGAGGPTVTGVLLDADAARSVQVDAPEAAPVAMAQSRRATELPTDWRWLLALLPLALLLGGVARQTPWLAGRLPRPPWRDV